MSNRSTRATDDLSEVADHLDGLPDGCGCAEVWEHLSDVRGRTADD